jgi:hypothetical protein
MKSCVSVGKHWQSQWHTSQAFDSATQPVIDCETDDDDNNCTTFVIEVLEGGGIINVPMPLPDPAECAKQPPFEIIK